jgi:hypothetical protein
MHHTWVMHNTWVDETHICCHIGCAGFCFLSFPCVPAMLMSAAAAAAAAAAVPACRDVQPAAGVVREGPSGEGQALPRHPDRGLRQEEGRLGHEVDHQVGDWGAGFIGMLPWLG